MAGALARTSCEESVPRCKGDTFTTAADWVHGVGSLMEILGIAGAASVLAAVLPRPWSAYSAATGGMVLVFLLAWAAVPYPWVGTAERALALVLVGWAAALGTQLATARPGFNPHAEHFCTGYSTPSTRHDAGRRRLPR